MSNLTTAEVRLSYVNVFKAVSSNGSAPRFSVTLLIPKSDTNTMAKINAAIEETAQDGTANKWNGVRPQKLNTPIHDGDGVRPSDDMPYGDECKGHWVITANANEDRPPAVVGLDRQPIIDQSQVYSGMYGYVNINFFAYNANGRKGIGCGLNAIMKSRDGEVLGGGRPSVDAMFGDIPTNAPAGKINPLTGQPM